MSMGADSVMDERKYDEPIGRLTLLRKAIHTVIWCCGPFWFAIAAAMVYHDITLGDYMHDRLWIPAVGLLLTRVGCDILSAFASSSLKRMVDRLIYCDTNLPLYVLMQGFRWCDAKAVGTIIEDIFHKSALTRYAFTSILLHRFADDLNNQEDYRIIKIIEHELRYRLQDIDVGLLAAFICYLSRMKAYSAAPYVRIVCRKYGSNPLIVNAARQYLSHYNG